MHVFRCNGTVREKMSDIDKDIRYTSFLRIKVWTGSNQQDDLHFIINALTEDELRWEYTDFSRKTKRP